MAITLTTSPPLYAFSGDQIRALFTLSDIYDEVGEFAVNEIDIPQNVTVGTEYVLNFRGQQVIMTAASIPDDSGNQFAGSTGELNIPIEAQLQYFESNYLLSQDFVITTNDGKIVLTARQKGISYNITGYNAVSGSSDKIKPNLAVHFILWMENASNNGYEIAYQSPLTVFIADTATAEAPINDKLHNIITADLRNGGLDIPEEEPINCQRSCRRYYFEYAEKYGEVEQIRRLYRSDVFTVIHGGMSSIGQATKTLSGTIAPSSIYKDRFLKQAGNLASTRSNQLQYLYYFNTRTSIDVKLKCRFRFTDGTREVNDLWEIEVLEHRKYAFNVSYENIYSPESYPGKTLLGYEIWLESIGNSRISETQIFLLDYRPLEFIRYFLNWSSWGAFDSRMFYGKGSLEFELTQSEAEKGYSNAKDLSKGTSLIYNTSIKSKLVLTTGFISNRQTLFANRDFFISAIKYRSYSGLLLPIKVTSKTIPELKDGSNLSAQNFEYEYLFEDHFYTEGDVQEPGLTIDAIQNPFSEIFLTDKEKKFLLTTQNEFITIKL